MQLDLIGFDIRNGLVIQTLFQDRCQRRDVVLDSPDVGRIQNVGGNVEVVSLIISTLQIRNCIANGVIAYLALIVKESSRNNEIQRIPVVENFPKVFIDVLPALPP